jgi:outer membrane protein with beta-barrel domain
VTLCFVLLLSSLVHAQMFAKAGFKGGVNFSTFSGLDVHEPKTKIGFIGGGYVAIGLSEFFFFQPEILFSMKGAKFSYPGVDVTDHLNYIEVPVLIKFVLSNYGNTNPYALLGPSIGFNTSAKYKVEEHGGDDFEEKLDHIASTDVGIVFGLGFDIRIIVVEARYTLGVTSIDDSEHEYDIKNGVISLLVGFSL